jgi:DNA repair exonuclease SbcCD ATPase subunit
MPESKAEDKKPKDRPKITIDDNDNEAVKNRGVNFLSGVLLVVLVVAAIFSFSIVAMELGEIKRLVGLKESTRKEIKENEQKISTLNDEISKLILGKLLAEQEGAKASNEAEGFKRTAKALEERDQAWRKAVSENNATYYILRAKNRSLVSENNSLNETLSKLRTQKSLLESQIKDLEPIKEDLSKYPVFLANKKAELDSINAQKQLAVQSKEQAEVALIELKTQITSLEQEKKKVLADKFKTEELAKLISREQAKLDEIKASILSAEKAKEDKTKLETQIANLEKKKSDITAEKIKNEELAKSALSDLTALKGESSAKLEQKIESEARHSYLVKENSRLRSERDALSAEILKLSKDYGRWVDAVKRAKAQNQSNQ